MLAWRATTPPAARREVWAWLLERVAAKWGRLVGEGLQRYRFARCGHRKRRPSRGRQYWWLCCGVALRGVYELATMVARELRGNVSLPLVHVDSTYVHTYVGTSVRPRVRSTYHTAELSARTMVWYSSTIGTYTCATLDQYRYASYGIVWSIVLTIPLVHTVVPVE